MTKTIKFSAILTATVLVAGMMVMTAGFEDAFAKKGASKQTMDVWAGTVSLNSPALDSDKSFSIASCNADGTLKIKTHLHKTSYADQGLITSYKVDGASSIANVVQTTPNKVGNTNFEFSITGLAPGLHDVAILVNEDIAGTPTVFVNSAGANGPPFPGIPFECP